MRGWGEHALRRYDRNGESADWSDMTGLGTGCRGRSRLIDSKLAHAEARRSEASIGPDGSPAAG